MSKFHNIKHFFWRPGSGGGEPQSICHVQAEGVYPTLEVMDARSCGSVEGLSKLQLWRLFNLDALNTYLRRDPSPSELTFRVPTRHRQYFKQTAFFVLLQLKQS